MRGPHITTARRLKTLRGLAFYEYICKCWTNEAQPFSLNSHHQMPGPKHLVLSGRSRAGRATAPRDQPCWPGSDRVDHYVRHMEDRDQPPGARAGGAQARASDKGQLMEGASLRHLDEPHRSALVGHVAPVLADTISRPADVQAVHRPLRHGAPGPQRCLPPSVVSAREDVVSAAGQFVDLLDVHMDQAVAGMAVVDLPDLKFRTPPDARHG